MNLYDSDNRKIASYHVHGWAKLDAIMLTWAIRHPNIEYITITVNPPDES